MKLLLTITLLQLYLVAAELDLHDVEIPDFNDFSAIKDKCDKAGGNGTFEKLKATKDTTQTCLQGLVDFEALKNEVEESKKTGSMDEVFGKYCAKRPKVASCVKDFIDALRPCLNSDEKKALNVTLDIIKQLGEFVCFRDGDRIAMFIAEGGVECIKDHAEGIKNCVNATYKINAAVNTNSLPNLLMDKKKCDDLGKLQSCVVEELEKCKDSTPANIVDALFRFIKRSACNNKVKRHVHSIIRRSAETANNLYNSTELKMKLSNMIKERCEQNAPEGGFAAFTEALTNAVQCTTNKHKTHPMLVTSKSQYKQDLKDCVETLTEKTRNCLPNEEKYWPQFYLDMMLGVIDFVYDNQNKFTAVPSRVELMNCFQNFKQSNTKDEITKCFKKSELENLKKETVCGHLAHIKSCFMEQLKKKCIQDVTTNKLSEDFFKALATPCNN